MNSIQIQPEAVITRLSERIGQMAAELAMRDATIDLLRAEIDKAKTGETPSAEG